MLLLCWISAMFLDWEETTFDDAVHLTIQFWFADWMVWPCCHHRCSWPPSRTCRGRRAAHSFQASICRPCFQESTNLWFDSPWIARETRIGDPASTLTQMTHRSMILFEKFPWLSAALLNCSTVSKEVRHSAPRPSQVGLRLSASDCSQSASPRTHRRPRAKQDSSWNAAAPHAATCWSFLIE